jgi:hypothetical protein
MAAAAINERALATCQLLRAVALIAAPPVENNAAAPNKYRLPARAEVDGGAGVLATPGAEDDARDNRMIRASRAREEGSWWSPLVHSAVLECPPASLVRGFRSVQSGLVSAAFSHQPEAISHTHGAVTCRAAAARKRCHGAGNVSGLVPSLVL